LARLSEDAFQAPRLSALAVTDDGSKHSAATRLGNVTLQIIRD
jgi:hypothetical protein